MASIQGVYLALFGRPADPAGLAYFNLVTSNGADLTAIGDLSSQPEYLNRFTGQSLVQIVQSIYHSLFNRDGDTTGVAFFVDQLVSGAQTINTIAINILDGAVGSDLLLVNKKLAAADLFTSALDTPVEVAMYTGQMAADKGAAYLSAVTATSPTVTPANADAAVLSLGITSIPGVVINLTAATDEVSPAMANPSFKSTGGDDTINAKAFLGNSNKIDGGAGTDSLFATLAPSSSIKPLLSNIEKVYVTQTSNFLGTLDFSASTGIQEIWDNRSPNDMLLSGISLGTKLGVEAGKNTAFVFKPGDVTGGSDVVSLSVKDTNSIILFGAGIEQIDMNVVSSSSVQLYATPVTMNISGTGNLKISMLNDIRTFDASGLNGALVNKSLIGSGAGVKFTGTKQADSVELKANGALDTIVFNSSNISTNSARDSYYTFNANGQDKIDVSAFGITTGKSAVTMFLSAPGEGSSFLGNAVGYYGSNTVYVDSNSDGVFDTASDLVFDLVAATVYLDAIDFIF